MKKLIALIIIIAPLFTNCATIYIDPTNTRAGQNGSLLNPFDSWSDFTLVSGNTYLQKRGTKAVTNQQINLNAANITLSAYGEGVRPILIYTGSGSAIFITSNNCSVSFLEIEGNKNAHSLIRIQGTAAKYILNTTIQFTDLHNAHNTSNAGFGVHAFYCQNLKVLYSNVYNVAVDGMYLRYTPNIEVGFCNVYDINKRYFTQPDQKYSSGDCIQFDGYYDGFHLHDCLLQRTNGAGNKFDVIFNSAAGVSDNAKGIVEKCVFITDANVSTALHIERGNGIITRYNSFQGATQGIRIAGQYASNTQIYGNEFINCERGVGIGATYPGGYPAVGTVITNNYFENISQYHIWVDKATVNVRGNIHNGKAGSTFEYNYGGGVFLHQ